jgi:hypothetical protein
MILFDFIDHRKPDDYSYMFEGFRMYDDWDGYYNESFYCSFGLYEKQYMTRSYYLK